MRCVDIVPATPLFSLFNPTVVFHPPSNVFLLITFWIHFKQNFPACFSPFLSFSLTCRSKHRYSGGIGVRISLIMKKNQHVLILSMIGLASCC